jgi:hypothetical protein
MQMIACHPLAFSVGQPVVTEARQGMLMECSVEVEGMWHSVCISHGKKRSLLSGGFNRQTSLVLVDRTDCDQYTW